MDWRTQLRAGGVIPAHPLALTAGRQLDERRQRALTRYYLASGVSGVAVGVHTTQFAIRQAGLYRPVLELAAGEMRGRDVMQVAGVVGPLSAAVQEARTAHDLGYHAALLSLGAWRDAPVAELIDAAREIAEILPLFGFYLQPAVGGRVLPYEFWRRFCEIPRVVAIKVAPFNRYQTIDVARAVVDSGRAGEIALYTGNDDNIIADLLTEFHFPAGSTRFVGGLLGHWAVWTRRAVELVEAIRRNPQDPEWPRRNIEVTDANAALFDAAHGFPGCIAGLHEILVRQGLLAGRWCLDPQEDLSPGQRSEIDRVTAAYPHLTDDEFVAAHRDEWLRP
jgi:dihydrodipicolinate synthase/N-acetylneuraminate lyase